MRFSIGIHAAIFCSFVILTSARADVVERLGRPAGDCQIGLTFPRPRVLNRLTVPFTNAKNQLVALTSVVPDFDRERDVIVGIRPGKHTYLINAQIGRRDPGIFGGRGKYHDNTRLDRLGVSPGLIIRLRLTPAVVRRMATEMAQWRTVRSVTCTNTTACLLAYAGVSGMHPFILTPAQLLRKLDRSPDLDLRYYMVNADADSVEEFEKQVKVIGQKKPPPPQPEPGEPRRGGSSCDEEACSDSCMIACFDLDSCTGMSQGCESNCGESGCSESGGSECGDCGGSDCDSDCCN